jgi:AcrR family transcriptional regulator
MKVGSVSKGASTERRTQRERTAQTRAALIAAARELFGSEGFADVGAERIARAAGMTRGALYHQFTDKADLLAAVLDQVEAEIAQRVLDAVSGCDPDDTAAMLVAGADAWLDASTEPDLQRIVLLDGPSVLGWAKWREVCLRHAVGLIAALLQDGIDRGTLADQPVRALTHVLVGAVDEAALYIAQAEDPVAARADMDRVIRRLVLTLAAPL